MSGTNGKATSNGKASSNGHTAEPVNRLLGLDEPEPKKKPRRKQPSEKTLAKKAARILELKAQASELYREIEDLQNELVEQLGVGKELPLGDGVVFEIIDPFVDDEGQPKKLWRHVPVGRYDFQSRTPKKSRSRR
jgi:hypothetical protein